MIKINNIKNIELILKEIDSLPEEEKKKLDKEVEDLCYDRWYCKNNGIDYCNITEKDIERLKAIVYLEKYSKASKK